MTLKVKLKGHKGSVRKSATIYCNDPSSPRVVLAIKGKIKSYISVNPSDRVSFRGVAEQLSPKTVEIKTNTKPFHIKKLETNLEGKITTKLETVKKGKHYRLQVENVSKRGNYNGFIKIHTDLAEKPELIVRVYGMIEGPISVRPNVVVVGKFTGSMPVRKGKVLVISNFNKPFNITKLDYDKTLVEITQEKLKSGFGYTLEIVPKMENIPVTDNPRSRKQVDLEIQTDLFPDESYRVKVYLVNVK